MEFMSKKVFKVSTKVGVKSPLDAKIVVNMMLIEKYLNGEADDKILQDHTIVIKDDLITCLKLNDIIKEKFKNVM